MSISTSLAAVLEAAGLQPSVIGYNPRRVAFADTAAEVAAAQPDLTVLVTYEEGGNLLSSPGHRGRRRRNVGHDGEYRA